MYVGGRCTQSRQWQLHMQWQSAVGLFDELQLSYLVPATVKMNSGIMSLSVVIQLTVRVMACADMY